MAENLISSPAYRVAFSMYVALGGDPNMTFDSVDAIYAAIDELYGKGTRVTIENLSVEITENGGYLYDNEEITGYKPVSVNVSVPQKYTDEQVESLKETARQEGYDSGYELGVSDGFTQGESEGYNDGYVEGLEDGAADQKELLEAVTFTENGTYTKEDGYNEVTVAVEMPEIPTFETEELSVELTENGTYNYTPTTDGYSKVDVTVNVGGVASKPKIYNGFKLTSTATLTTRLADIDFSQYDWSAVYDLSEFFKNFKRDNAGATWFTEADFENFKTYFNGNMVAGEQMFAPPSGSNSSSALRAVPDFSKFTSKLCSMKQMFFNCTTMTDASNLALWNTSNVVTCSEMFNNCSALITVPLFDTSKVVDMNTMFGSCTVLSTIPAFDTSKVTNMMRMFSYCDNIIEVPAFDTSKVTDMSYMFQDCDKLTTIPLLDASNVTTIYYMFYNAKAVTTFGGLMNFGMQRTVNTSSAFSNSNQFTHDSLMNIINNLYDRASAGYSTATLPLGSTNLAKLSNEEKAVATQKGWTLS